MSILDWCIDMKRRKIENCRDSNGYINLNKLESYREKGEVVEGKNAKCWYNVDGCRFLFKEYKDILPAFGEVLYSKVAALCNVSCAEYDFAIYNGKIGTISYDFLSEDKVYYNCFELTTKFLDVKFSLEDIKNNKELLIMHNNKYNNLIAIRELLNNLFGTSDKEKREIEIELIKRFCLDTVFLHRDRNLWNYGTIVDERTDTMGLAPSHDNSYVLCLEKGEKYIEEVIVSLINGKTLGGLDKLEVMRNVDLDDDSMIQLVKFYHDSGTEDREIIDKLISDIDVENTVQDLCEVCEIGDVSKLWIKALLNYRKFTILNGLENVKINDNKANRPNFTFSKRK